MASQMLHLTVILWLLRMGLLAGDCLFIYILNVEVHLQAKLPAVSESCLRFNGKKNVAYFLLWSFISCEKTNLHSSAYLDSQQVWLIAAASRTGSIVRLSTKLVCHACQLSKCEASGKPDDGWQMRTLAAFTTCSIWCQPLGAAQFIGSEKPRQAEPTAATLAPSATSSSERRSKRRPGDLFRELPGAVHSSLLLNRSRVVSWFSTTKLEGIRRQSSEDTAARAVNAKLCFCPFQMETFGIWGGRFSRFRPLYTENGQGSCPKVCSCQSLKLLPQTFNFDLGTELAAPTEMLQFHWMLKNESTFGAKFWYPRK